MSMGITSNITGASQEVISAIKNASQKTGLSFDYLVNQARTESSFRPDVKAKTSSATGLYQFIDQTWLATVSKHGSKHGLGESAAAIKKDFNGRYFVSDDAVKKQILNLRKDPNIASLMAAEFALDNQNYLESKTGIDATQTDLYMAHFLGAGGASKYIKAMQENPYQPAAYLLPAVAKANKNIFYNSDGSMKSLTQIYNNFEKKFGDIIDGQVVQTANVKTTKPDSEIGVAQYQRDISFERMYGSKVDKFITALPSIDGFESGDLFQSLYGDKVSQLMAQGAKKQSLFLTLTMLDLPK
jgi:hypothetical protein